jgi:hypothetical protein
MQITAVQFIACHLPLPRFVHDLVVRIKRA